MRVGLVFGGRSVEHRVSVSSARTVASGLRAAGHEVVALGIAPDGCWVDPLLGESALAGAIDALDLRSTAKFRRVCIICSTRTFKSCFPWSMAPGARMAPLQGLCEMLDLPYVGADVTASAISMDKLQCKRLLLSCGIAALWTTNR